MALTLAAVGAASQDAAFVTRVIGSLYGTCSAISNEASNTANHVQRMSLVARVLANPTNYGNIFAIAIASVAPVLNDASVDASTDADINNGVSAVWNMIALAGI